LSEFNIIPRVPMNLNFAKSVILCLCLSALFQLQSCSDSKTGGIRVEPDQQNNAVSGSKQRSEGTTVTNEMAQWIGTYRFTDSPMTSFVDQQPSENGNVSYSKPHPTMVLQIFEQNAKLVGHLLLTDVYENRDVNVVINGSPSKVGVYFISSNGSDKSFEEKGELLFCLFDANNVLTTTWKSWYPLNANEFVTSGFIKDPVE